MNHFQIEARLRQAVFCFSVLAIFMLNVPLFGQEKNEQTTAEIITTEKSDEKTDQPNEENKNTTTDFVAEKLAARKTFDLPKLENQSFRKSYSELKNESKTQQQTPGDDTMMGVMGKGTDSIKLGGHVGFVVPIVARGNGVTTNVGDRFVFGFPVGLTLKTKRNIAIDFEFIPTFNTGRDFVLTIHPGIIYGFAKHYAVGVRAAYDAGAGSFGFTPLVSRGFKINDKVGFFIEADFPIRSNYRPYRDRFGSIAFAAHAGFAF
jgi:hypothetical protein